MSKQKIIYNIGFNVDGSGLQKVRQELKDIKNMSFKDAKLINADLTIKEFNEIQSEAKKLENILKSSFNEKLGTFNLSQINQELSKSGNSIESMRQKLLKLGATGTNAFRNFTAEILTTKDAVKETSKWVESMAKTFGNTIKWSIASSTINTVTGSIQQAWNYTQKLDTSLNDIRIVTGKSAEEMEKFAKQANKAAKSLGSTTTNYTNASLIYYQQGLGEKDVAARTETTIKAANVTGQSAAEVSEQLTAVWNGYKVVAEEAELYVDKLAAVAASTAADLEELSTGMSKVASAANAMGVDVDQLSAQLSTIISVTRQDASVVGTALKTIYSRMGDLKVDGVDEFGTSLGDVSGQLQQMGINVLDQEGNLRDMGTVIEEVAAKWGTWTDAQQQAAAVAIAGKRQYNNLIALFENWNMYESALTTSKNSAGTLQQQQDIYAESIKAKLKELTAAGEKVFDALLDSDVLVKMLDGLADLVDGLGDVVTGFGGLGNILLSLGAILPHVFKSSLISTFNKGIKNITLSFQALNKEAIKEDIQKKFEDITKDDKAIEKMTKAKQDQLRYSKLLTAEEQEQYDLYIKQTAEAQNRLDQVKEEEKLNKEYVEKVTGETWYPNLSNNEQVHSRNLNIEATELDVLADTVGKKTYGKQYQVLKDNEKALFGETASYLKQLKGGSEELQSNIADLIELKELEEKTFEKVGKTNSESYKRLADAQKKFIDGTIDGETYSRELSIALKETAKQHRQVAKAIEEGHGPVKQAQEDIDKLDKEHKEFQETLKTRQVLNTITDTLSGVLSLASTFNSLTNITKIWKDETAEAGEKVTATISSLISMVGTLAPTIVTAITQITSGVNKVGGIITLVAVGITLISGIVTAIVEALPKQESALEKAQKAAEDAAAAAEEAAARANELQNAYSNVKSEIDGLIESRKAIDSMTEGTQEWKNAVLQLNSQVLELITKYPELVSMGAVSMKDGVYDINEEAMKEFLKQEYSTVAAFSRLSNVSAINLAETKKTELQRTTENDINNFAKSLIIGSKDVQNGIMTSLSYDFSNDNTKEILTNLSNLGIKTEYFAGDDDVQGSASIDLNSLYKLDDAGREALLNAINSGDYGEEVEKFIQDTIDVTEANNESMATQNSLINENTKAIYASIAAENGYDTEVLTDITKTVSRDINDYQIKFSDFNLDDLGVKKDGRNKVEGNHFGMEALKHVFFAETRFNVDGADDQGEVASIINKALTQILPGHKIVGPTAADFASNKNVEALESITIKVDGEEMSIRSAVDLAASENMAEKIKAAAGDLDTVSEKRLNQNIARYMSGRKGEGWTDATINDYNDILRDGYKVGADIGEARTDKNTFVKNIAEIFGVREDEAERLYGNFTQDESTNFKELRGRFGSEYTGKLNQILGNVENSEQMKSIYSAMKKINFNDSDSIADFFFKFTGDIQTKIAKRELDYFKNINKELDTIESKLENVFGLEKDLLLQRRVELEKQAKAQADANLKNANFVYGSYVNNYAADLKGYQNADGSLDIMAVNDRIAKIMAANPNNYKDNEEYKKLSELSEHWDWVIESEQAAQDAIYKVIDAQIEAFNYAYEVQKQINETLRQWRDFSREFKDDISDFDKSAGIAAADAAFAQISDGQLDFALAEDKIVQYEAFIKNTEDIEEKILSNSSVQLAQKRLDSARDYEEIVKQQFERHQSQGVIFSYPGWSEEDDVKKAIASREEAQKKYDSAVEAASITAWKEIESQFVANGVFNSAAFFEAYQNEISSAITALESAQAGIEALYESYLSIQDEILETYDKEIEKLSKINSILKGSADLAKMAGIDSSGFYSQMSANSGNSFAIAQAQLIDIQTQYANLGSNVSKEMADKVRDNLAAAGENVLSTAQEYYSSIAEQFSYELQELFNNAAGGNLAGKTEAWELAVAQDQRYLDDVNEAYARGELDRRFKQSLEETDNISAQNKLLEAQRKIEAQLTAARDAQGKLRQADLDRANAEYDLALKRIALEEAQQASNKMQLTRDASGNYSYQFVADQDAIAKAEDELAAAENNLYNMDKERTQSLVSEYYSTMSEANSQIAEAMAANDQERVARLKDYYFGDNGLLKGIQSELGIATTGLNAMTGVYKDFTDSILTTDIGELGTNVGNVITTSASTMSELSATISTLLEEGGVLSTLPVTLENAVIKAVDTSDLTDKATDIVTQLPGLIDAVNTLKITLGGTDGTDGYIQAFKKWVNDNSPTSTDVQLKNNVQGIYDVISNGMTLKAVDSDGDGFFDSYELEANDTSKKT